MSLLEDIDMLASHLDAPGCGDLSSQVARIRAALADHEHLEKGARLFVEWASFRGFDDSGRKERETRIAAWLAAEAKRKDETDGH